MYYISMIISINIIYDILSSLKHKDSIMKNLFTTLLIIASVSSASTVHYDQKSNNEKSIVKYSGTKSTLVSMSKPNHPSTDLYTKS